MQRSFFAIALAFACSRTEKLDTTAVAQTAGTSPTTAASAAPVHTAPAPVATPADARARAERLFNETVDRHGAYLAMAANAGNQRSTMERFRVGLEVFQSKLRCPAEPDAAGVERVLRGLADKLGLTVESISVTPRSAERPARPKEVPDGTRLTLLPSDLRGVVGVTLIVRAAPSSDLVTKIATETIALPRLISWEKAATTKAGDTPALLLTGEAYWFFDDVAIPKVAHRTPTLADALAKAGLSVKQDDPGALAHLEKARKLFAEIGEKRSEYGEVLELVRQTVILRERLNFVRDRRSRQDASPQRLKLSSVP